MRLVKIAFSILATVLTVIGIHAQAFAKETSSRHVIGFSSDGKYFAFEEFGVADGIGVAYGTLYVIDVERNDWVKGSPVRIPARENDEEEHQLKENESYEQLWRRETDILRSKLRTLGQSLLDSLGPWQPGTQRAHNLPWELSAEAQSVRFTHQDYIPYKRQALRLDIKTTTYPAGENCYGLYPDTKGLTLTLTDERNGKIKVLQSDKRVPKSRGCVQNYRIEEVLNYQPAKANKSLAVLIRYEVPGYEGADGRLMAVTAKYEYDQ